ncbi:hypothetical protein NTE_00790 [Candidatus Nitrososphaera evergladensis SR1]|jgi:Flp pilus assembly protein TadB|uniref:Uncharacterized protein n=2 Tax=Nitrososphaera TaxID=497726 RepID=A0A075MNT0_9ARCH|nr:hypothetical protein NTE_00790 [Candidatus Nitrososphaera evergladensis SR1]
MKRRLMIINIAALAAMFVAVVNLVTLREVWVLAAAVAVLVGLAVYSVNEKFKLKKQSG